MERGRIAEARLAFGGIASTPVASPGAAAVLAGQVPSEALWRAAGEAASAACDPPGDIHGSSDYRRGLVAAMLRRALRNCVA